MYMRTALTCDAFEYRPVRARRPPAGVPDLAPPRRPLELCVPPLPRDLRPMPSRVEPMLLLQTSTRSALSLLMWHNHPRSIQARPEG